MTTVYFSTNCMFTRVEAADDGTLDWDTAEVGSSEDYWATPNEGYPVAEHAGARIEYEDLPANLQE